MLTNSIDVGDTAKSDVMALAAMHTACMPDCTYPRVAYRQPQRGQDGFCRRLRIGKGSRCAFCRR